MRASSKRPNVQGATLGSRIRGNDEGDETSLAHYPSAVRCDLVIPAFNESANIDPLFDELEPHRGLIRHIIVGDNGSTDDTAARCAARGAVVVHEPQRGYGAACLKALAWIAGQTVQADAIVFLDADLSDDPAELERLLEPIAAGRAEIVIGSRTHRAAPGALNPPQRFGGWLACTLMRLTTGRRYTDLGPFRAITPAALDRLEMADRTWGWTVEMQVKAALLDLPVEEVDVAYRKRRAGKSKISGTLRGIWLAGWKILITIAHLWWRRRAIRERAGAAARS